MLMQEFSDKVKPLLNKADNSGNTPLHFVAGKGFSEIAMLLMEHGGEPSLYNDASNTAACIAAARGHVK